jgi:hypothetical protein
MKVRRKKRSRSEEICRMLEIWYSHHQKLPIPFLLTWSSVSMIFALIIYSIQWKIYSQNNYCILLDLRYSKCGEHQELIFWDILPCRQVKVNWHTASIFRVKENAKWSKPKMSPYGVLYSFTIFLASISSLGTSTQACMWAIFTTLTLLSLLLVWLLTLKMEAVQSSKMLVTFHHIPDDSMLPRPSLPRGEKLNVLAWISAGSPASLIEIFVIFLILPDKCHNNISIRPLPFPLKSFPIHHSFIILPFNAVQSGY